MPCYAQTNVQLLNQLRSAGCTADELRLVRTAYDLAIRLHCGQFRASGKTFIAHLVGTASVLGSLRVGASLIAAGLLHAAYQSGDFGDRVPGMTNAKRAHLKASFSAGGDDLAGAAVEAYVARYQSLPWGSKYISSYYRDVDTMSPIDREVLLMRLANELDEYLDLGILYRGDEGRPILTRLDGNGRMLIMMAERLGFAALGTNLAQAFTAVAEADFSPAQRGLVARSRSFTLAPMSYQRIVDGLVNRRAGAAAADATTVERSQGSWQADRKQDEGV
jgi:hypothetical protein